MKKLVLFISICILMCSANAQEQKVEVVSDSLVDLSVKNEQNEGMEKLYRTFCGLKTVQVFADYNLPFKLYEFSAKQEQWLDMQSVYNTISVKTPGVSIIPNPILNGLPNIRMRGNSNTILIVDGIRQDISVLNTLNAADIESVIVAPSTDASNYLLNARY